LPHDIDRRSHPIPFTDLTSRKVRPAIVVGCNGDDLLRR